MNSFHVLLDLLSQVLKCFWSFLRFLESCLNRLTQSLKQSTTDIKTHGAPLRDPQGYINLPELLGTPSTYRKDWASLSQVVTGLLEVCSSHTIQSRQFVTSESADPRQLLIGTEFPSFSKFPWECKNHLPSVLSIYQCIFVWVGLHHLHKAKFLYPPASVWSYSDPAAITQNRQVTSLTRWQMALNGTFLEGLYF